MTTNVTGYHADDITTVRQLKNAIADLEAQLINREMIGAYVDLELRTSDYRIGSLYLSYKTRDDAESQSKRFYAETWEDIGTAFEEAHAFVAALPSKAEIEHAEFMKMVGRAIDRGHDMGIDVQFLNPLTAMMEALATNALTKQ
jgi:hypothetical protein